MNTVFSMLPGAKHKLEISALLISISSYALVHFIHSVFFLFLFILRMNTQILLLRWIICIIVCQCYYYGYNDIYLQRLRTRTTWSVSWNFVSIDSGSKWRSKRSPVEFYFVHWFWITFTTTLHFLLVPKLSWHRPGC